MTPKETFKADIESLDIPEHIKSLIIVTGDLYAAEMYAEGFMEYEKISKKTKSIFNN